MAAATDQAIADSPDLEAKSEFAFYCLDRGPGSKKVQKIGRDGATTDTGSGLQVNEDGLVEDKEPWWKKQTVSRRKWVNAMNLVKKVARKYKRYGFTEINTYLETADWWVCQMYLERFMEEHFGVFDVATDETLMNECWRIWQRAGCLVTEKGPP